MKLMLSDQSVKLSARVESASAVLKLSPVLVRKLMKALTIVSASSSVKQVVGVGGATVTVSVAVQVTVSVTVSVTVLVVVLVHPGGQWFSGETQTVPVVVGAGMVVVQLLVKPKHEQALRYAAPL